MAVSSYFNHFSNSDEQSLLNDLVKESIQIHGIDVKYLPRTLVNIDTIFGEEGISQFNSATEVEMYIDTVNGFEGEGDFYSRFGLQIRDQLILTVSRERWAELSISGRTRPYEGDLIYFPLNDKLFEIRFVEHEKMFYSLGELPVYQLTCELFEYSSEQFETGNTIIDDVENDFASFFEYSFSNATLSDVTAVLTDTSVSSITINDGGNGYYGNIPSITISEPEDVPSYYTTEQVSTGTYSIKMISTTQTFDTIGETINIGTVSFDWYYSGALTPLSGTLYESENFRINWVSSKVIRVYVKKMTDNTWGNAINYNMLELLTTAGWYNFEFSFDGDMFAFWVTPPGGSRTLDFNSDIGSINGGSDYQNQIFLENGTVILGGSGGTQFYDNLKIYDDVSVYNGDVASSLVFFDEFEKKTATASLTISNGVITDISVTNGGLGYTSAPTVTITEFSTLISNGDEVTGQTSETVGEISEINYNTNTLRIIHANSAFTLGEVIKNSSNSVIVLSSSENNEVQIATNVYSDNAELQSRSDNIFDFTETDPFSEGNY